MRSFITLGCFVVTCALMTFSANAAEPKLGEAPPEIKIDEWLSAQPDIKDKPVLLEFWATWCPPCRKSIPHLNEIYEKYKDKDIVIIGVSNEESGTVKEFQKSTPLKYPNGLSKDLINQYGVQGIPHAFLIGKDGKLIWSGHPMGLKDADIDKALK